jgi:hypothetical protein
MLTTEEKKLAALKYITVAIGVITGFVQPAVFSRAYSESDFTFLLLIFGYATYLSFFDFGVGKPAYATIRMKFIKREYIRPSISNFLAFYSLVLLTISVVFTVALLIQFYNYKPQIYLSSIIIFSLSISVNVAIGYMQHLLNAVDDFLFFQKMDLYRKIGTLVSILLIFIDDTLLTTAIVSFISCYIVLAYLIRRVLHKFQISYVRVLKKVWVKSYIIFIRYFEQSKNYLIFTVNETLIYNGGYFLIPAFFGNFETIQFSLWMKIFLGVALIVRVFADTLIHRLTKYHINGERESAMKVFKVGIILSIASSFSILLIFTMIQDVFFRLWTDEIYVFNSLMLSSLWIWSMSNAVQHVSGTFLLAEGMQFRFMKRMSTIICLSILIVFGSASYITNDFANTFFAMSIVYMIGSCIYFVKAIFLLKLNRTKVEIEI